MNANMSQLARPFPAENAPNVEEEIARLASLPSVRSAMQWFRDQEAEFARWQMELARIPAPPFGENERGEWVGEQFRALGIKEVTKDKVGNVLAYRRGQQNSILTISAHIDTVFPA